MVDKRISFYDVLTSNIRKEGFWIYLIDFIKQFSELFTEEKEQTLPPRSSSLQTIGTNLCALTLRVSQSKWLRA